MALVRSPLFVAAVQRGRGPGWAGPGAQTPGLACRVAAGPLRPWRLQAPGRAPGDQESAGTLDRPHALHRSPGPRRNSLRSFVAALEQSPRVRSRGAPGGARPFALRFSGASRFAPGPAQPAPRPCRSRRGVRDARITNGGAQATPGAARSSGRRGAGFAGPLAAPPWGEAPKALRGGPVRAASRRWPAAPASCVAGCPTRGGAPDMFQCGLHTPAGGPER